MHPGSFRIEGHDPGRARGLPPRAAVLTILNRTLPVTPAARLHATLDLLTEVAAAARPVDAVTSGWFRARRDLGDKDRGEVLELLYALLRHQARLGWWLDRQGARDTPRNRVLAWLVLAEGRSAEQVRRLFDGAPAALTQAEAALVEGLRGHTMVHPAMAEEVRLECPDWAAAPLRDRFGAEFAVEMAAMLVPPPIDLRVNAIRTTREAVLRDLGRAGIAGRATPLAPFGIRIAERMSLSRLPGLKTGEIEIQDEGSQLVAALLDAQAGDRVVDFCAGAGGKTLAIAAQMGNRGRIIACDINEARLKRCAERLRRAGVHNAETRLLTSETDRWIKRHKAGFDRVLIDAPCSGTGTWRRNPDARWRAPEEKGLDHLVACRRAFWPVRRGWSGPAGGWSMPPVRCCGWRTRIRLRPFWPPSRLCRRATARGGAAGHDLGPS